jgi:heterodisulfide reductase subunit D
MAEIPDIEEDILACIQCGYCNAVCPTYEEFKWESASPRGKLYFMKRFLSQNIIEKLFRKNEEYKKGFVKSLYICASCGACNKICPVQICTESYRRQEIAQATVKILNKANIKFTILGTMEQCCGSPLLRTGQSDIVKQKLIPQNIDMIEKAGVTEVVTACAGCHQTLTNDYPKVAGPLPFKVMHISQYINRLILEDILVLENKIDKEIKVTYHDPCHLGRHTGVFEAPRKVLTAIPGVVFSEMRRNRMGSRCCGAGGGFKIAFNDKATTIGSKRVLEAIETNAELIITTCPFCKTNLLDGAEKLENGLKTYDLVELIIDLL